MYHSGDVCLARTGLPLALLVSACMQPEPGVTLQHSDGSRFNAEEFGIWSVSPDAWVFDDALTLATVTLPALDSVLQVTARELLGLRRDEDGIAVPCVFQIDRTNR